MKAYWEGDYVCFLRDDETPHEYMRELTQTELDAERYRWLRDKCTPEDNPQHTWIVEAPGDMWDAAIAIGLRPALVEFGGDKEAESFAVELVRLAKQRGAKEQKRKDAGIYAGHEGREPA